MPGWQQFYQRHKDRVQVISIAVDGQGAKVVKPWTTRAETTFPTLVDSKNKLVELLGIKAIPFALWIDEQGRLVRGPYRAKISSESFRKEIEEWLNGSEKHVKAKTRSPQPPKTIAQREALARFQLGKLLLERGKKKEAMAQWKKALKLDPKNWIIHKQIWAVENPDKFYKDKVDFKWQREQLKREGRKD